MARPASLNPHLLDTGTPPIPEAQAWARLYDGSRGPLIDLTQAAPGSPPPQALLDKFAEAGRETDATRYGAILGDAGLREAFAAESSRFYGEPIAAAEIAITAGCNQGFVTLAMALARAGDNLLLPAPWYFNHEMTLTMLGIEARPLALSPEAGFVPTIEQAASRIDSRTRAIVLVTPNNPTGAIYPPETIAAFADLCATRDIWLVLDETYRDFLPAGTERPHGVFGRPGWQDHAIGLYSFSKAYAVPGWRLGAITAGERVLAQIGKALDCIQISPVRAGQSALAWCIGALAGWREESRAEINRRSDAFRAVLVPLDGWRVRAAGAYFAYVEHPLPGALAAEAARRLAAERGVLTLPGSWFGPGQERYLRIAVANVGVEALAGLGQRLDRFR